MIAGPRVMMLRRNLSELCECQQLLPMQAPEGSDEGGMTKSVEDSDAAHRNIEL
ncbi:MAG: hypothetical protein ACKVHP_12175 [Verrucomicrobiales bacterium]